MIPHLSERALILAPLGRDAEIASSLLSDANLLTEVCPTLEALQIGLTRGAGFAIVAEESLRSSDLHPLSGWIEAQPEWSDFPFILLTQKGGGIERNPSAKRLLDVLGNVTFLERPFHPTTLISLAKSAIRGRRRQYEARARLEELRLGEQKYRSLFNSIDAGFCIIEVVWDDAGLPIDYRFIETNPAFFRQTGIKDAEGKLCLDLVPGHEQVWFDTYGRIARTGNHERFEEHASKLGIWYEVYAFPVGNGDGSLVAVLFNDISDRRRMEVALRENEERLRALNETLEERVSLRTSELAKAQDALRQSQKLEAIGQLTGGIAHDFNNLLMAIMSSMSLLRKRIPSDPATDRLINNALQGVDRGAALTQRMLAFARRQDLTPESLDVGHVVNGIVELVQRTLGPSWPIELSFPDSLLPIVADTNQLEMALLNLAVNARDAMADGGVILIRAEQRELPDLEARGVAQGTYVGLSVIDTGCGMDAATLERATEPFFTTKGIGRGTGLGLSMIHGLAQQLGGTFTLKSTPGIGTTATLWLPADESAQTERVVAPPAEEPDVVALGRLKVLAVDDDALILLNTAAMLEEMGHTVLEANSGSQALEILAENPDLDLLITDQAMPNMTGAELVRNVSASRPDLPVILATGYGEVPPGFEGKIIKIGKPFDQTVLAGAIVQTFARLV